MPAGCKRKKLFEHSEIFEVAKAGKYFQSKGAINNNKYFQQRYSKVRLTVFLKFQW